MKTPNGMSPCEYIYGVRSLKNVLEGELYETALKLKIQLSEILIDRLYKVHYTERDNDRIRAASNSKKFNEELLRELR